MGNHSFTKLYFHIVFATKNREPLLEEKIRPRLFEYLKSKAKSLGADPLAVGGYFDHVHLLAVLPASLAVADFVRKIKTESSQWMSENTRFAFRWQTGYAAFTVSESKAADVEKYIGRQEQHHATVSFGDEFAEFLLKHGFGVPQSPPE